MDIGTSNRLATAYALLEAYSALSPDQILSQLDDDGKHQILPESLGMPARSKQEYGAHAAGITSVFKSFKMIPQAIYEDVASNAVIIHAKMDGELAKGSGGRWENECIMLLSMNDDGTKIVEIKEFVDSDKAMKMRNKVKPKHFGPPGSALAVISSAVTGAMPVILGGVAGAAVMFFSGRRDILRIR
ncbi:hypothetical protein AAFC00_005440 [Neodothiora populina]|uniref:SnoaL-like domain-containing protein n=1 Tax=Neodothiora populina TaxID=2781224 RepID=A0ABR3PKW5_9PEZI